MNRDALVAMVMERLRTALPQVDELTIDSLAVNVGGEADMETIADRIAEAVAREVRRMG